MRTSLSQFGRSAVVALPLMTACASMAPRPVAQQRFSNAPEAFARIRDSLITRKVTDGPDADEPRVRIIPPAVRAANYVDATIEVSRDAYVLVVATDLDGQVRVVFPESPDRTGFVSASAQLKLPKFFGGFGPVGLAQYGRSAFSVEPPNRYGALGSMVAIASDRPLQLARITNRDGDWDEAALERLVYGRSPTSAGYSLGTELSLAGRGFDAAYSGFSQSIASASSANAMVGASLCESDAVRNRQPNEALYYDSPRTTFFERDGTRYAMTVSGDPCTGYQTRTVPIGPAMPPMGASDSASSARGRAADPRLAGDRTRDARERFRPSDKSTAEPQPNDADRRTQAENERERARVAADERNSRRPLAPTARPTPEPTRREPPQVRQAPPVAPAPTAAAPAAPAAPSETQSAKPRKE